MTDPAPLVIRRSHDDGVHLEIKIQIGKQSDFGDCMMYYSSFLVRNLVGKYSQ